MDLNTLRQFLPSANTLARGFSSLTNNLPSFSSVGNVVKSLAPSIGTAVGNIFGPGGIEKPFRTVTDFFNNLGAQGQQAPGQAPVAPTGIAPIVPPAAPVAPTAPPAAPQNMVNSLLGNMIGGAASSYVPEAYRNTTPQSLLNDYYKQGAGKINSYFGPIGPALGIGEKVMDYVGKGVNSYGQQLVDKYGAPYGVTSFEQAAKMTPASVLSTLAGAGVNKYLGTGAPTSPTPIPSPAIPTPTPAAPPVTQPPIGDNDDDTSLRLNRRRRPVAQPGGISAAVMPTLPNPTNNGPAAIPMPAIQAPAPAPSSGWFGGLRNWLPSLSSFSVPGAIPGMAHGGYVHGGYVQGGPYPHHIYQPTQLSLRDMVEMMPYEG